MDTYNIIYQHSNRFDINRFWTGHFWTGRVDWARKFSTDDQIVFSEAERLNDQASPDEPVYVLKMN